MPALDLLGADCVESLQRDEHGLVRLRDQFLTGKVVVMLKYCCPITKRIVETGIETNLRELGRIGSLQISLWCPYCQAGHSVAVSETFLSEGNNDP
jgi:hypothetical protein